MDLSMTPKVKPLVEKVRAALGDAVTVGVGSVLQPQDANAAIDAGSQFVVTPALRRQVISACVNRGVPVLSGGRGDFHDLAHALNT